jgi:hypothetical protein
MSARSQTRTRPKETEAKNGCQPTKDGRLDASDSCATDGINMPVGICRWSNGRYIVVEKTHRSYSCSTTCTRQR